ncbi:MAG: hydrogenase 4 subunit B, partial [Rhodospirillales bacterium]|nr:hydrogenase 4 subunit B [Rhodospirillales bacterium]
SIPWLSIVPVSSSRSSYNGLLLFGFVAVAAGLAVIGVHRFASRALRRAPFWDCGYPGLGVRAQYSATSLAQPIRRVFASVAFAAHEEVAIPAPGDIRPAVLRRFVRDPAWDFIYTPVVVAVAATATLLNRIQFLTIRRYLSFVFLALVVLLVVLALWG